MRYIIKGPSCLVFESPILNALMDDWHLQLTQESRLRVGVERPTDIQPKDCVDDDDQLSDGLFARGVFAICRWIRGHFIPADVCSVSMNRSDYASIQEIPLQNDIASNGGCAFSVNGIRTSPFYGTPTRTRRFHAHIMWIGTLATFAVFIFHAASGIVWYSTGDPHAAGALGVTHCPWLGYSDIENMIRILVNVGIVYDAALIMAVWVYNWVMDRRQNEYLRSLTFLKTGNQQVFPIPMRFEVPTRWWEKAFVAMYVIKCMILISFVFNYLLSM